jgi:hypothetical protein
MFLALVRAATRATSLPPAPAGHCILDAAHALPASDFQALDGACKSIDAAGDGPIGSAVVNDLQGIDRPEYAASLSQGVGHRPPGQGRRAPDSARPAARVARPLSRPRSPSATSRAASTDGIG